MLALVPVLLATVLWDVDSSQSQTPYFSKFGDQVLSKAEVVVVGRVESVSPAPRSEVVTVEVVRTFKGEPN